MVRFVGLDVHKRVIEVCIIDEKGVVLKRLRFDLTRESLLKFATEVLTPQDKVALEATTNTWAVVRLIKPHVTEVVVSNPMKTKAIAEAKVKTDKVDAFVLAQLLRCDFLPRIWEPDERTKELRRLTSHQAALVGQRTQLKNRIHSVLAQRLILPPVADLYCKEGLAWLRTLDLDEEGRMFVDSDLRLMDAIDEELKELSRVMAKKGYSDDRVKLLMSLSCVDSGVAMALLSALGDVSRFRDGDHAASYLGLVPRVRQSADKCRHGRITKAGNGHVRSMLVQAAQHFSRSPGPLGVFFRRTAKKRNHNIAVIATARKMVVIAWHMLSRNQPYHYAQPRSTQGKLARLRIQATGQRRKNGNPKGTPWGSKVAPGVSTYTIKPLAQVYQEEGLPEMLPPAPGEIKAIREACVSKFVESLSKPQVKIWKDKRKE